MTPIRETIARAVDPLAWVSPVALPGKRRDRRSASLRQSDAVLRALDEAGFSVVPKEPTRAMMEAAMSRPAADAISMGLYTSIYRAMVGAAPTASH